jgi:hypothetical protein
MASASHESTWAAPPLPWNLHWFDEERRPRPWIPIPHKPPQAGSDPFVSIKSPQSGGPPLKEPSPPSSSLTWKRSSD